MKQIIQIEQILEYYDVPQVFVGSDIFGAKYISMLFDDTIEYTYLAILISKERLHEYLSKKVDLRSLFISPEIEHNYKIIIYNEAKFEVTDTITTISEEMLPKEGFYCDDIYNDSIINETYQLRHPIIHLGFEDPINSHSIELPVLSLITQYYQSLFTHCYTKVDGKIKDPDHNLRAYASTAASFNLHLYATTPLGIFGGSRIEKTLMTLEALFHFKDEKDLRLTLSNYKGHVVSSYKNLIHTLLENKLAFKYKWLYNKDGNGPIIMHNKISVPKIESIYSILSESSELENEIKEFVGYFIKIDVNTSSWKLFDINNKREYNGSATDKNTLYGITVQSIIYKITCQEIIEYNNINVKGKMIYKLKSITTLPKEP